ncbi:MAG TPA: aminoglycoside adenylyltransferase domain-containing protein [Ktedonobacterales bacterium]
MTPYDDVNAVLTQLSDGLTALLGGQLLGLYLTGSLTYGDFDPGRSDIDFLAVLSDELSGNQLDAVTALHERIGAAIPHWAKRLEGSYITKEMIETKARPDKARPYVNAGEIHHYPYGNEWTINLYALQECGVALMGPAPQALFPHVSIEDVRAASRQDLIEEWLPKLDDPDAFQQAGYDSDHLKAYAVLTMCRVLHRAKHDGAASKRVASRWVKETYGEPWRSLVEQAEFWQHGKEMSTDRELKDLIAFTARIIGIVAS